MQRLFVGSFIQKNLSLEWRKTKNKKNETNENEKQKE